MNIKVFIFLTLMLSNIYSRKSRLDPGKIVYAINCGSTQ